MEISTILWIVFIERAVANSFRALDSLRAKLESTAARTSTQNNNSNNDIHTHAIGGRISYFIRNIK